jgi:hypothetical protein
MIQPLISFRGTLNARFVAPTWEGLMTGLSHIYGRLRFAVCALLIQVTLVCAPAYADGTPVRVRGTVVSLDGSKLVVHAKDGNDVAVGLPTLLLRWPS